MLALVAGTAGAQVNSQFGVGVQMMGSTVLESAVPNATDRSYVSGMEVRT